MSQSIQEGMTVFPVITAEDAICMMTLIAAELRRFLSSERDHLKIILGWVPGRAGQHDSVVPRRLPVL